jgi:hypothetical protein
MKLKKIFLFIALFLAGLTNAQEVKELCSLKSPNGLNTIYIALNDDGMLLYRIEHKSMVVIENSPMGLKGVDEDYSRGLSIVNIAPDELTTEKYQLFAGNKLKIEKTLIKKQLSLKNGKGSVLIIELAAADDGVGFKCRLADGKSHTILQEQTGFQLPESTSAWLEPYHAAGPYSPAYEDFYYNVNPGEMPTVSREKSRGWCLPALFNVTSAKAWLLVAESGTDESYCACHLRADKNSKMYKIEFAYEDEVTGAKTFNPESLPQSVAAVDTPWRIILIGDKAGDFVNSSLVTDLAAPSKIADTSWIKTGRASWSWWSSNELPDTKELYNKFTDMAEDFGWEYTLFDAGWWNTDLGVISKYAESKQIRPLAWMHAIDFYNPEKRKNKLDDMAAKGIKGIKVDFWCSDRQQAMAAMQETLKDAADRKLVVVLHGCTIPRGWHRTWLNLLSAEGVLGTECYFCESHYPEKAAQFNTILPFTRNILAPMDTTPFALTIKKFPRKTTAAHELAASIVFTSGIIHYAESPKVFYSLPTEVKQILRDAPAAWDETRCLIGEPGKIIVLARRKGNNWFIAGLNGTDKQMPIALDFNQLGKFKECVKITEGKDLLMEFSIQTDSNVSNWQHQIPSFGGFVLNLKSEIK